VISAIVFSKDRPMQLDALLSSLEVNRGFDAMVLYAASTPEFWRGYKACIRYHLGLRCPAWMKEFSFREDVEGLVRSAGEYVCFFTDDDILYRPLPPILYRPGDPLPMLGNLLTFSLRLGANTTRCYPHDAEQRLPDVLNDDEDWREWDWRASEGDFGYPSSLDGHVFHRDIFKAMLMGSERWNQWHNPNTLEDALCWGARDMLGNMGCFPHSVLVNVPANRTTETHDTNRVMDAPAYTTEALNEMFLDGWRIDWQAMKYTGVNAAHCELTYVFSKDVA
jgi:hypothetical protein